MDDSFLVASTNSGDNLFDQISSFYFTKSTCFLNIFEQLSSISIFHDENYIMFQDKCLV